MSEVRLTAWDAVIGGSARADTEGVQGRDPEQPNRHHHERRQGLDQGKSGAGFPVHGSQVKGVRPGPVPETRGRPV